MREMRHSETDEELIAIDKYRFGGNLINYYGKNVINPKAYK